MGTLAPPGGPVPTAEQTAEFEIAWQAMFGTKLEQSPVPEMYDNAKTNLRQLQSSVLADYIQAIQSWKQVLASNPDYVNNAMAVTNWRPLLDAVSAVHAVEPKIAALRVYSTLLDEWYANNQGSLTPKPMPAVPSV